MACPIDDGRVETFGEQLECFSLACSSWVESVCLARSDGQKEWEIKRKCCSYSKGVVKRDNKCWESAADG